jgi:hypothetical protein
VARTHGDPTASGLAIARSILLASECAVNVAEEQWDEVAAREAAGE